MTQSTNTRLLAIAIDAAEPSYVRHLIDEGEMPALASLLRAGTWLRVKSPAYVGSGAVWPTFISAQGPRVARRLRRMVVGHEHNESQPVSG